MTTRLECLALSVLLVLLAPYSSAGQEQDQPNRADWNPRRGASRVFGLGYQSPDGPALSAGVIIGTVPGKGNKCIFGATSSGLLLQGHVGLNGPKASAGIAQYNPAFGMGAKVSALHLWRSSANAPAGSTFVGPEAEVSITMVRVNIGYLWPVAGRRRSSGRFSWGAGVGF